MFKPLITKPFLCALLTSSLILVLSFSSANASSIWQLNESLYYQDPSAVEYLNEVDVAKGGFSFLQESGKERSWLLEYNQRDQEHQTVLGFQSKRIAVSMLRGEAQNALHLAGDYQGVDPYLFHGGLWQKMNYRGAAINYKLNESWHMQFGQAKVDAKGLQERSATYTQIGGSKGFLRYTDLKRNSESLGYALDLGTRFGNKSLAFQRIEIDDNKELNRMRFMYEPNAYQQIWFDVGHQRNDLFKDKNDYSMMLSFKALLGKKSMVLAHNKEIERSEQEQEKGKGWNRGLFIGAAAVGAAALSSSGSESQDDIVRFNSQNAAARAKLNAVNPKSVRENREYGGYVFINPDGSYAATPEVPGNNDSVLLPAPVSVTLYGGVRATATYHTHAAFDPRYDNENFSPTDLESDRALNLDGYLGTPAGQFKYHNVRTGQIITLGRIAN